MACASAVMCAKSGSKFEHLRPSPFGCLGLCFALLLKSYTSCIFCAFSELPVLKFGVQSPFASHLGFTLHRMEAGESELHYEARPEHLNSLEVTHGGASMALLDVAMATAARSQNLQAGVVTIEMKTSFIRPARGLLVAKGRIIQRTATLVFTEGSVFDAQGRLCSHATGTFQYVRRLPRGGTAPAQ